MNRGRAAQKRFHCPYFAVWLARDFIHILKRNQQSRADFVPDLPPQMILVSLRVRGPAHHEQTDLSDLFLHDLGVANIMGILEDVIESKYLATFGCNHEIFD